MDEHTWIDRQEYPFQSNYLPLETGRLHYLDEGRGAPIVMVWYMATLPGLFYTGT